MILGSALGNTALCCVTKVAHSFWVVASMAEVEKVFTRSAFGCELCGPKASVKITVLKRKIGISEAWRILGFTLSPLSGGVEGPLSESLRGFKHCRVLKGVSQKVIELRELLHRLIAFISDIWLRRVSSLSYPMLYSIACFQVSCFRAINSEFRK